MDKMKQNYYGSLCTELYELLHKEAPREELDFYLSYAEKDKKILEVIQAFANPVKPVHRISPQISQTSFLSPQKF